MENLKNINAFFISISICKEFCAIDKNKKDYIGLVKDYIEKLENQEILNKFPEDIYNRYNPFSTQNTLFLKNLLFCKYVDFFPEYLKDLIAIIQISF